MAGDDVVEKLMAINRTEFETGLERLSGAPAQAAGENHYVISWGQDSPSQVKFGFEPQPDAVLGGLVRMPRVRVSLFLGALSEAEADALLFRFDRVFQRGGG